MDLARERRIRSTLATMKEALVENSELARRTQAVLTGRLSAPDLEGPAMSKEDQVSIRLSPVLRERAEKLARKLKGDLAHGAARVTRAYVLRLALLRGLDVLEEEHAAKSKK